MRRRRDDGEVDFGWDFLDVWVGGSPLHSLAEGVHWVNLNVARDR